MPEVPLQIIAAGGTQLEHKGSAQIQFELADGNDVIGDFQVAEIGKAILSVAQMVDEGYVVEFGPYRCVLRAPCGEELLLERSGGIFGMPARAKELGGTGQVEAMPVELQEGPMPKGLPEVVPLSQRRRAGGIASHIFHTHSGAMSVPQFVRPTPRAGPGPRRERRRSTPQRRS